MKNLKDKFNEKIYCKGGGILKGNPLKKVGKGVGDIVGSLTGAKEAEKAQKRAMEEARRQAEIATAEEKRRAEEEAKRRAEERARAEAEAKAKAEAEAKRQAELEAQRKREEAYRQQVAKDTEGMQREIDGLQHKQNLGGIGKPQTNVDFSKAIKLSKNDEEDKLKKLFKGR